MYSWGNFGKSIQRVGSRSTSLCICRVPIEAEVDSSIADTSTSRIMMIEVQRANTFKMAPGQFAHLSLITVIVFCSSAENVKLVFEGHWTRIVNESIFTKSEIDITVSSSISIGYCWSFPAFDLIYNKFYRFSKIRSE